MKIVIIGAGSIGLRHLQNIVSLGYRTISIADPEPRQLRKAQNIAPVVVYADYRKALRLEKPDAVLVCVPAHLHVTVAAEAVRKGAHLFIEKPLSSTSLGIRALKRSAARAGKIVMVACNYRFHPAYGIFKKTLQYKVFGTPLFAHASVGYYLSAARRNFKKSYAARRREGGGVILDSGSHVVDYLFDLFGPVSSGFGCASKKSRLGIAAEEAAQLFFLHQNGVRSSVSLDYLSQTPRHYIEVETDAGAVLCDFKRDEVRFEGGGTERALYRGDREVDQDNMFIEEMKHFFDCIRKRRAPISDIENGWKVLETLTRIHLTYV